MSTYTLIEVNNDHLDNLEVVSPEYMGTVGQLIAGACRTGRTSVMSNAGLTGVRILGQSGLPYDEVGTITHYKRTLAQSVSVLEQAYKHEKMDAQAYNRTMRPWAEALRSTLDISGVPVPRQPMDETFFHDVPKLRPEFKKKWVGLLRTTPVKQGYGNMVDSSGGFCCLTIGCLVDGQAHVNMFGVTPREEELDNWFLPGSGDVTCDVPIGLYGHIDGKLGNPLTLTALNDHAKLTFDQIADVIEYFL